MSLHTTNQKGFTIVELLIVIVVIAILAAISIVAYTGIQSRARTSSGQQLAAQVEKKAQVSYTLNSSYPANYAGFTGEAALEGIASANLNVSGTTITTSSPAATAYTNGTTIAYRQCGSGTGAQIAYWDFSANTGVVKTIGTGTC